MRRLDSAAAVFDQADFVHDRTAHGILERLLPMRLEPVRILDLGCGTGARSRLLTHRFPGSRVIGVDLSAAMLARAAARRAWFSRPALVQGDAGALPFADDSIDLVFANMLLPYIDDLPESLDEIARVLRHDGLFVFATLGPDSFTQLRSAWLQTGERHAHVRSFPDMHVIGDAMVSSGLRDPVIDVEYLDVNYSSSRSMYRDLTAIAARNSLADRCRTLAGRETFRRMQSTLAESADDGQLAVTLELVFGHGWGTEFRGSPDEYHIDPRSIGRRAR